MDFNSIINAAQSNEFDRPLMQKENYPVSEGLRKYLQASGRDIELPVAYNDLLNYRCTSSIRDKTGKLTHWEEVEYTQTEFEWVSRKLLATYTILKGKGNEHGYDNLSVTRIDYCDFGNSMPFRIWVTDTLTDSSDCFYIKLADASRVYGLELEHLITSNRIDFLCHRDTLVEAHIHGIPGDLFLKEHYQQFDSQKVAKAFIRFNEQCFARLLGDMRSYNFVVIPDGDDVKIRAIDFDQQSYEGKLKLYLPQFYKENWPYVKSVSAHYKPASVEKIREAERALLRHKYESNEPAFNTLLSAMEQDELSEPYKVKQLQNDLNHYFKTVAFSQCTGMGSLVRMQLSLLLGLF